MKKLLTGILASIMSLTLLTGCSTTDQPEENNSTEEGQTTEQTKDETTEEKLTAGVFYYNFADVYISTVRTNVDKMLDEAGIEYQNYDGAGIQATQIDQINTAVANGVDLLIVNAVEVEAMDIVSIAKEADLPIIFFNREVGDDVISSYEKAAYIGTSSTEAGHLQGQMIGDHLTANYDAVDLNGDGEISYVMFKGQEGNVEAEGRTKYGVEDANTKLTEAGKPELVFYDANNTSKYLVDQGGNWSAQAATDYMNVILAEYSENNGNMIELIIANNDGMAEGAISSLQSVGYNTGEGEAKTIPVFGVDATDSAKQLIAESKMTGTIMQDAKGMAEAIVNLASNIKNGEDIMANTDSYTVDESVDKIRVPYSIYSGE